MLDYHDHVDEMSNNYVLERIYHCVVGSIVVLINYKYVKFF